MRRLILEYSIVMLVTLLAQQVIVADDPPSFSSGDLTFAILECSSGSKLDFGTKKERAYTIGFEGMLQSPSDLDIVCVSEEFHAKRANIAGGESKLEIKRASRRSSSPEDDVKYNAVFANNANTKMRTTNLTANPFTITELLVKGRIVVATSRAEHEISAIVEEDLIDVGHGIKLRLSAMRIGAKRDADITINYTRAEGSTMAFLESVEVIDDRGKIVGGGRWAKSLRIFASRGTFKAKFNLDEGASVAKLKCVFVTEYEVRPVEFTIDGIFQM